VRYAPKPYIALKSTGERKVQAREVSTGRTKPFKGSLAEVSTLFASLGFVVLLDK
jgi:hypothetical protein